MEEIKNREWKEGLMHTFKIEIENEDILNNVLDYLMKLKNRGVKVIDLDEEFSIDTRRCLDLLEREKRGESDSLKKTTAYELFDEIGI